MRTTLDINDRLLTEAKVLAARERKSLTKLIEEGLALRLRPKGQKVAKLGVDIPLSKQRGGLRPGIDGTSNKSLFRAAEEES